MATSLGITLQNSQLYEKMKERDRLAALGEMAAGLAHEIRNPLGAIKGAAQYLEPSGGDSSRCPAGTREFLHIIVEEVNRLDGWWPSSSTTRGPTAASRTPTSTTCSGRR